MGHVIFTIGGLIGLCGLTAMWMHVRTCQRVVVATKNRPDRLESGDILANWRQQRKWKILKNIIKSDSDELLKQDAQKALRCEVLFYVLWVSAMIVMFLGASMSN